MKKAPAGTGAQCKMGFLLARKQGHDSEAVARFSEYCSKKSPPCQSEVEI